MPGPTVASLPTPWSYLYRPGPTFGNNGTTWKASIVFLTTTGNLAAFVDVVAGLPPTQVPVAGGGTVPRIIPLQHPLYPRLYAKDVQSESFGTPSPTNQALSALHSHARVTVNFESPAYSTDFDGPTDAPYMKKTVRSAGRYVTIPGRRMTFSNSEQIDQDTGVFVAQAVYVYTFYQCTSDGDDQIRPMVGRINDTAFLGFPDGQLRLDNFDTDEETSVGGVKTYVRTLTFTYQDHHWNDFFRRDGTLDTANDAAGNPVYEHAEFNDLLTI